MNRKINLYPAGPYYQVRITYVWERIIVSDPLEVFIDDVTIMDNECSKYDLPPVPCPDGKLWRCRNARCIPLGSVCDGNDDCGDYSDEQYESCDASRVRSMAWKLAGPLTAFVIVLVLLFLMCCVHRMKTKESPLGGAEDRMKYRGYDLYTVSDSVMDTYTNEGDGGNMKKSSSQRYLVDDG
ncbi:uncharacterized protein LOC141900512 [Tubulanus polymorphus]|uniref:uncharacterized protein LOC141900512 n=1 Tax=Tubulanus polymorphus TaxID=672921 RepID=UPI003DA3A2F7